MNKPTITIGEKILEQFLSGYSVEDIAEEYSVNCLMIEEVLRCEMVQILSYFREGITA